ncbi:uncharacterized protein N7498_006047 [Penicillium cinerascens]|uniref:Uncharacterized protein n=1 Tax=Penicillium cinerascens TaxID=70096 RepID=A0A9W9MHI5_9EURO|nr:uncharacterized protein N7498_006047 [Penicillium cinerascens]KAJ5201384.1 hypothetical protein N7498_006047 [Penicillium cinerascens]
MANDNALLYKLTATSKEKLAREATAPDPDLRRCVAHFRLHCFSVQSTEKPCTSGFQVGEPIKAPVSVVLPNDTTALR